MKLMEAQTRISKLANIPFKEYLSKEQVQDAMMRINKGKTGQLLELTIGLKLSNTAYYMFPLVKREVRKNGCTYPLSRWTCHYRNMLFLQNSWKKIIIISVIC